MACSFLVFKESLQPFPDEKAEKSQKRDQSNEGLPKKQSKGKKEMNSLADRAFLQQVRDFVDQSGESSDSDNSEQKRVTKFKGYKQSVPVEDSALRQAQTAHTIQVREIQEFTQLNNRRYNQLKEIVTNNPSQLEKQKRVSIEWESTYV